MGLTHTIAPLLHLLKKDSKFVWLPEHEAAFQSVRDGLRAIPILAFPDESQGAGKYIIQVDASDYAIAGTFSQASRDGKEERLIACYGRALRDNEKKWTSADKEGLALVTALLKYKHLILGNPGLELRTDCRTIRHMKNIKHATAPRLARWSTALSPILDRAEWTHVSGSKNVVADALSRQEYEPDEPTKEEEELLYDDMTFATMLDNATAETSDSALRQEESTGWKLLQSYTEFPHEPVAEDLPAIPVTTLYDDDAGGDKVEVLLLLSSLDDDCRREETDFINVLADGLGYNTRSRAKQRLPPPITPVLTSGDGTLDLEAPTAIPEEFRDPSSERSPINTGDAPTISGEPMIQVGLPVGDAVSTSPLPAPPAFTDTTPTSGPTESVPANPTIVLEMDKPVTSPTVEVDTGVGDSVADNVGDDVTDVIRPDNMDDWLDEDDTETTQPAAPTPPEKRLIGVEICGGSSYDLRKLQTECPSLGPLMTYLRTGELPDKSTKLCRKILSQAETHFLDETGLLRWCKHTKRQTATTDGEPTEPREYVVVPVELRQEILIGFHHIGHCGINRMLELIDQANLRWERMYSDVRRFVLSCKLCAISKRGLPAPKALLKPWSVDLQVGDQINCDVLGPFVSAQRATEPFLV